MYERWELGAQCVLGLYHKQADLEAQGDHRSGNDAPLTPTILSQCTFLCSLTSVLANSSISWDRSCKARVA
jgi:hypothetical protein